MHGGSFCFSNHCLKSAAEHGLGGQNQHAEARCYVKSEYSISGSFALKARVNCPRALQKCR